MNTPSEHKIVISPIDDVREDLIEQLRREVHRIFGIPTEIHHMLSDIQFALDPDRNQYHSTAILEALEGLAPPGTTKVLAVTEVDLFIPILTHVYGEAQLGGMSCIVSTYRLKEGASAFDPDGSFKNRVIKEAIHELGQTFKLRHCRDKSCIMHYCHTIRDVDRKSDQLCRYCQILLDDELKRLALQDG